MRVWSRVVAVLAVVLAFGVAACDPGEDPTNPPTSESSSGASESPSSAEATETTTTAGPPEIDPPEPPDGMFVDDHQGAALAAGYFLETERYMYATGDSSLFEAMSGPDCNYCTFQVNMIEEVYAEGGWIEGGHLVAEMDSADVVLPTADQPAYTVRFTASQAPMIVHNADGTTDEPEVRDVVVAIGVLWVEDHWVVLGVNVGQA